MTERVRSIKSSDKIIFIADYSDLKELDMLEVLTTLKKSVLSLNKPVRIISVYNEHCYITPAFMRKVEAATKEAIHLIEKQAVVGLTPVKKLILKGYNFMFNLEIKNFNSEQEAIRVLLNDVKNP